MVVLCDTCSVLMLIRIAPDMFSDARYGAITLPGVAAEFVRTQKFTTKYPWRSQYKPNVIPELASSLNDSNYNLFFNLVKQLLDSGVMNEKTKRLFDLSFVDKQVVSFALASGHAISTGDQGIIDFAAQEFPDEFKGNISPLELINAWVKKGIFEWDEARHRILEEWAITNERPQPKGAKSAFKKITGKVYPGP